MDKTQLTQVGRALSQLGITHIPSYAPQARGRMERVFGTLQNRLPQELRLAEIKTLAAANRYLTQRFVPDYNARFAVPAAEPGSAFVPYVGRPIEEVLTPGNAILSTLHDPVAEQMTNTFILGTFKGKLNDWDGDGRIDLNSRGVYSTAEGEIDMDMDGVPDTPGATCCDWTSPLA